MHLTDTMEFLLGTWRLERTIDDEHRGTRGEFTGTATLRRRLSESEGVRADYEELGELRWGAHNGPASRRLEFVQRAGSALLRFTDGRPYVDLDLRGGTWRAVHDCGEDRYEITTTVQADDVVLECWRVRGPTKRYNALTVLTRSPG